MKPKEIARLLRVPHERYLELRRRLRDLEKRGELRRVGGNRYLIPRKTEGESPSRPPRPEQGKSREDGARSGVVGTYHRGRSHGSVRPLDPRASSEILIPLGAEAGARSGDVVVVRVTQSRGRRVRVSGQVERVLGRSGDPGVDVRGILHSYGLPEEFPAQVEAEARLAEGRVTCPGDRTDRRDLHVIVIDPNNARDHDDALSVTPLENGLWEVGIHIADVSHFVEEGSALDREAHLRGTSVYLVDQVVPMLPHALSSGVCSLIEGEDRLALSLILRLDGEGKVRGRSYERTWIRCARQLDYDQAQEVLTGKASVDEETDRALKTLDRLAKALRKKRRDRGSLDFDLPEARVVLDEDGIPVDILRTIQLDSHRLIEDFMILANEVVATDAKRKGLHIPYRVHEPPAPDKAEGLRALLAPLGYTLPRDGLGPKSLQQVLDRAEGRPEAALVSTVVLRSMARARYDAENLGHFGLASRAYTHFTSPIRRFPDLVLHRMVARVLVEEKAPLQGWSLAHIAEISERSSERERVAQQAERDSVDMKKIEFMSRHLGDDFEGTISGVTSFGLFVLLDRFFVDGLVHIRSLEDDFYTFLPEAYALVGKRSKRRLRLGDRVSVRVVRTDKEARRIDFLLIRHRV
ncbi:MAG: ribonuclease R [Gemmatimonadetes bacterium]|nr:ribonuclease R [Gemmatimonadota bacterium]